MKQSLLDKYNVPVPRYTSYPPANYFHDGFSSETYKEAIIESNDQLPKNLSFYIHIPFCLQFCHYCGCNSYPISTPEIVDRYLDALHKEIDMVIPLIKRGRKISQIHFGGGTPTSLPVFDLKELHDHLMGTFNSIDNPEIAIECHPGWMAEKSWIKLSIAGFNRFSIGIQDFNYKVLSAVHRKTPLMKMEEVFPMLRSCEAQINLDFIYGLPHQTEKSFAETIERAASLQPDRLVTFSYAHLPSAFPRQKILEKRGLPSDDEKSRMFEAARNILSNTGYKPIGMDHFVRESDSLYTALKTGQLHRNFQGYCTHHTTGQVYAFGVSGISQLSTAYAQNTKDIMEYIEKVEAGILPVAKGYLLNHDEQITREVIEMLMCNYRIDWDALSKQLGLPVETIKQATAYDEARLRQFADDGLIEFDDNRILMTPEGRPFVRNVAASLDKLMSGTNKSFSKPV